MHFWLHETTQLWTSLELGDLFCPRFEQKTVICDCQHIPKLLRSFAFRHRLQHGYNLLQRNSVSVQKPSQKRFPV